MKKIARRRFIQQMAAVAPVAAIEPFHLVKSMKVSPADKIRIATIGMGIQGHYDTRAALKNPDIELVAVADLYTGRLERAKVDFGNQIFTTRDYREVLQLTDVDAVLIVTSDHWHAKIAIDALAAGKHVYCEKPMVKQISEGLGVIDAWKKSGKTMQVGSQRISGADAAEAKRMIAAGEIGVLNYMESNNDRFNAIGAWNYSIPPDASPATVDWDTFLGNAPKRPFDATRFFRWRNYRDYGTGVAGDLFVHLLTTTHYVTNSYGPTRIYSSGGLYHWNDGRDVPDVLVSVMDYPKTEQHGAFQAVYRVNFANAGAINNSTRIIGDEGEILFGNGRLTLTKKKLPKAPGYGNYDSYFTFTEATQQEFVKQYNANFPEETRKADPVKEIKFDSPKGDDAHAQHFGNFFDNIRKGSQGTIEDPIVGFRAAGPALACNESYFSQKVINWDPVAMKVKKR
jgi:predicted dehydrogenase